MSSHPPPHPDQFRYPPRGAVTPESSSHHYHPAPADFSSPQGGVKRQVLAGTSPNKRARTGKNSAIAFSSFMPIRLSLSVDSSQPLSNQNLAGGPAQAS